MSDEMKEPATEYVIESEKSEFADLAENIDRDRIAQARRMSPEEKFLAGEELFEYACSITLAGIRTQNPGLNEEECRRILEERIEWREQQDWEDAEK